MNYDGELYKSVRSAAQVRGAKLGVEQWNAKEIGKAALLAFLDNVWHDKCETPEWKDGDNTGNQIIVYGETRVGKGCSICSMIDKGVLYAPITGTEYKWGDCPFEKWAYVADILPKEAGV